MDKTRHAAIRRTGREEVPASPLLLVSDLLKSAGITAGIAAGGLLLFSLAASFAADPDRLIRPFGIACAAICAFSGGAVAGKMHGHGALLCGFLNGAAVMAVMMILSLFFRENASGYSAGIACLLHAGFLGLSILGGYVGTRPPKPKKRHGKRK